MSERYVVLGLTRNRASWFTEVARWCTNGTIPAQFLKCVSVEEVRARLNAGRAHSALLLDHRDGVVDRDLIATARAKGCGVIVVADPKAPIDLAELGVAARLSLDFTRAELLDALATHTLLVADTSAMFHDAPPALDTPTPWSGRLVAVCGPGGTGTSTLAAALAQQLATDPRHGGLVALADLALAADQAVLHGADDIVPGLPELVDACRRGRPDAHEMQRLTFAVPARHYRLLLGLRRHRDWAGLRAASVTAAISALTAAFQLVVADIEGDLEGDRECGLIEIEDRNLLARRSIDHADAVVVVGGPGLKGMHALARQVTEVIDHGYEPRRILPVVNRAPRRSLQRAELTRALGALVPPLATPPLFIPDRNDVERAHRDGTSFPKALAHPLQVGVDLVLDQPRLEVPQPKPEKVAGGSVGAWSGDFRAAQ